MKLFNKKNLLLSLVVLLSFIVRTWQIDSFPSSLYSDEASQGFNAYSIYLTGKDEHGAFLPMSLRSFGDWKPPLPAYLMIPFIHFFGLNAFSIRLPSVILGTGSVFLSFFLGNLLFKRKKLSLLSSLFLAISPWHIVQSRSAMLIIVSLFFWQLGIFAFLMSKKRNKFLVISASSFALSIYAYYGMRVITPLTVLFLLLYRGYIKKLFYKKVFYLSVFTGFVILLPLLVSFAKNPDVVFGRAKTVSVFYDQGTVLRQWELITQDGLITSPFLSRILHNKVYMYGRNIAQRFLSHIDGHFLFLVGDQSPPFQIPNMGVMYLIDGLFLIYGVYLLISKKMRFRKLLFFLIMVSVFPAALTFMTPSANRTFSAVLPLVIVLSTGVYFFQKKLSMTSVSFAVLYMFSFGYFLYQYFLVMPIKHANWWNWGWRQAVELVDGKGGEFSDFVIYDVGMPYVYFLIYQETPPDQYQKKAVRSYVPDEFGYEHVDSFESLVFAEPQRWLRDRDDLQEKTLYLVPAYLEEEMIPSAVIYYPDKTPFIKIYGG